MAEALIKYETIDSDQIDDIMSGKTPREPQDWNDTPSKGSGTAASSKPVSGKDGADPIGGPAGQH
jgi:cell division protease FtsH